MRYTRSSFFDLTWTSPSHEAGAFAADGTETMRSEAPANALVKIAWRFTGAILRWTWRLFPLWGVLSPSEETLSAGFRLSIAIRCTLRGDCPARIEDCVAT